jgi:hypothetical protein
VYIKWNGPIFQYRNIFVIFSNFLPDELKIAMIADKTAILQHWGYCTPQELNAPLNIAVIKYHISSSLSNGRPKSQLCMSWHCCVLPLSTTHYTQKISYFKTISLTWAILMPVTIFIAPFGRTLFILVKTLPTSVVNVTNTSRLTKQMKVSGQLTKT